MPSVFSGQQSTGLLSDSNDYATKHIDVPTDSVYLLSAKIPTLYFTIITFLVPTGAVPAGRQHTFPLEHRYVRQREHAMKLKCERCVTIIDLFA